jgi:hypothetical protein
MVSSTDGWSTITGLEAAFERGVLFDMLAVFIERGGPDAVQLAARQHRLEQVAASIEPSALPAPTTVCNSSINRMMLPGSPAALFQTALRRSSNSPRYFAPGHQRAHVERHDALVLEPSGHVAAHDAAAPGPSTMRRLSDTRLADQHRVCSWCGARAPE